ncbi:MAG: tetratricopeptide repeat protein [Planctomycetota bacterium]|nr:tetratricopeptide repeat protein [Planctomycetota bacterium]
MTTTIQRLNEAEKLKDQGQLEEATALLNGILTEDDSHVLSHMMLARIYTQTGKHEDAVKHAERACELEPNDSTNFTVLSVTYQRAWAGTQDQRYIQMAEDAMARSRMISG